MANPNTSTRLVSIFMTIVFIWILMAYFQTLMDKSAITHDRINDYEEEVSVFDDSTLAFEDTPTPFEDKPTPFEDTASLYSQIHEDVAQQEPFIDNDVKIPMIADRVAIIIEDRALNILVPLVLHFASVLGPAWPVFIYTSSAQVANLSTSVSLGRWSHQIALRELPENQTFTGHDSVSSFLTRPWIWEQLAPADHVLIFQADSILCANAPQSVDDFLQYDFIGAPVQEAFGSGYNGGLSLRNRNKVLDLITEHDWEAERNEPGSKFEDQWFYTKWKDLPNIILPTTEVAQKFSVETIYYDRPLGYHQIGRWQSEHLAEIEQWCPEIKMTIAGSFA